MKAVPASVVTIFLAVLGALVFLVYVDKMPVEVLTGFISVLLGGGAGHVLTNLYNK